VLPRNHASLEAGENAVGDGLVGSWPADFGCVAMVALCHNSGSPVLPARGKILKENISPLALNQISFVECPRFMSLRRAEARRIRSRARALCAFMERQRTPLTGSDWLCHKAA
jgi:hypothetical protein